MKKIIISIILFLNFLHSAEVQELPWPKGESFLTFLEKYSIPQKLYFDLEKEDKELCSEIVADKRFYLYTEDNGDFNQVLIPVSDDIQLHIYKESNGQFKFQTLPINYEEYTETIAVPISVSVSHDLQQATGDVTLALQLKSLFKGVVDFRKMQKGDFVALKYKKKSLLGRRLGLPELEAAMVEIRGKKYYRIKNSRDDKYYNEKGKGFTKSYFFKIPLTYKRISSVFTKKRWHPVLKRYRAHLGTDFAAPRGRKIYAAAGGKVEFKGRKGGYGNTIIINHHNGYKTLYAHQNGFKKGLKRGQRVKKGQHIGYVGTTGLSSGPHLHLGLYKNGRAVDPMKVIKRPKTNGLSGKKKATFIANAKKIISNFNDEMKSENRTQATKLNRLTYKSEVKKL
ncbi:peptidoglycan DD-metalloendopeptidase family protein [Poseidonibacter lekithochrous]|uniref:peptidoglycan DD-metalloendopeptidase family protein n=1 Tax=Poseidonibacter TaxID=2321187 RepID=UPI001C08E18C|nr:MULTISPECIES: peptidoglycan DD-metalloendopeptidase family protein [Poseidonibacter]MBU3015683.1 peptidoglycan DD-metalloendopeptidase family protein [Poseidonibacter lekithochrous]MDO6828984.1 peptidoglycan DD-metalloendopeptidase family protein [Poseidonibacter sp. 1_MG-2023]